MAQSSQLDEVLDLIDRLLIDGIVKGSLKRGDPLRDQIVEALTRHGRDISLFVPAVAW